MSEGWALAAFGLLLLVHVAVIAHIARRAYEAETRESAFTEYRTDEGVVCPTCKSVNQPEYEYCRSCASELPVGVSLLQESAGPQSRRTL